jgi:hypothetical protein
MAKAKTESQTIVVNTISGIVGAIMFGVEMSSDVLREFMPTWGYALMIVAINIWNGWRRTVTTEPVE